MTRPTKLGYTPKNALLYGGPGVPGGGVGGDPTLPPGAPPTPACCEVGVTPPDRALAENGATAWTLSAGGPPELVQSGNFGSTSTLPNPTTPGNTLVVVGFDRTGPDGGPDIVQSGYTKHERASVSPGRAVAIWTKVADGSEDFVNTISFDETVMVMEWVGAYAGDAYTVKQDDVASTTALDTGGPTTPPTGSPVVLIGAAVMATPDAGSPSVMPDSGVTELVDDFTGGFSPLKWAGYREVATPSGAYSVSGVISTAYTFAGVTVVLVGSEPTWSVPAPRVNDGDDETYEVIP